MRLIDYNYNYNPYITGEYDPLYTLTQPRVFFMAHLAASRVGKAFSRVKSYCWTIVCHHLFRDARRCHSRSSSLSLLWGLKPLKKWMCTNSTGELHDKSIKALETSRSNSSPTKKRSIFSVDFKISLKQMKIERLIHQHCNSIIQYWRGRSLNSGPVATYIGKHRNVTVKVTWFQVFYLRWSLVQ